MANPLSYYQPDNYTALLQSKTRAVEKLFSDFSLPNTEIFESPQEHFRMRAEFRVWHQGDQCSYAVFDHSRPKEPILIDSFPIATPAIEQLLKPLMEFIHGRDVLRKKLFQIEFLSTTRGEVLVSMIYHKKLDDEWKSAAIELEGNLNICVIGRARKQKIVLSQDRALESLAIAGNTIHYYQPENSFTQPNAAVNQKMIEWACNIAEQLKDSQAKTENGARDLLELYCGNGNFTLPLARHFRRVLATEVSKTSIRAAQDNCLMNGVGNIQFVRLSSEETVSALRRDRAFRRLAQVDLDQFSLSTLFVDPPRAGLDNSSLELAKSFEHIIYISCNPQTMAANLHDLNITHEIKQFALFDQFPYTDHCECGMLFQRRG